MNMQQERTANDVENYAAAIDGFTNADTMHGSASSSGSNGPSTYDPSMFALMDGQAVASVAPTATIATLKDKA